MTHRNDTNADQLIATIVKQPPATPNRNRLNINVLTIVSHSYLEILLSCAIHHVAKRLIDSYYQDLRQYHQVLTAP